MYLMFIDCTGDCPQKLWNSTMATFGKKIPCIVFETTDSIRNSHFKNKVQTIS